MKSDTYTHIQTSVCMYVFNVCIESNQPVGQLTNRFNAVMVKNGRKMSSYISCNNNNKKHNFWRMHIFVVNFSGFYIVRCEYVWCFSSFVFRLHLVVLDYISLKTKTIRWLAKLLNKFIICTINEKGEEKYVSYVEP